MSYVGWAAIIGALCASSLLIGALIGVKARIAPGTVGLLAAFGGGALLSALATELVAPTVLAVSAATTAIERAEESGQAERVSSEGSIRSDEHPSFLFDAP